MARAFLCSTKPDLVNGRLLGGGLVCAVASHALGAPAVKTSQVTELFVIAGGERCRVDYFDWFDFSQRRCVDIVVVDRSDGSCTARKPEQGKCDDYCLTSGPRIVSDAVESVLCGMRCNDLS